MLVHYVTLHNTLRIVLYSKGWKNDRISGLYFFCRESSNARSNLNIDHEENIPDLIKDNTINTDILLTFYTLPVLFMKLEKIIIIIKAGDTIYFQIKEKK